MSQDPQRFSDEELEEFRVLIEKKLEKAKAENKISQGRLDELEEHADSDRSDYIDDSSNAYDVEQLNTMVFRQLKHIQDLENALSRVKNRNYGVCVVTGQLIDKRRLLAVPTTTKSLEGKAAMATPEKPAPAPKKPAVPGEKRIITKIIKKKPVDGKPAAPIDDDYDMDDDDMDDLLLDDDDLNHSNTDLDQIADPDSLDN